MNEKETNKIQYFVVPDKGMQRFETKKELRDYLSKNSSQKCTVIKGREGSVEISNKPIINVNF